MNERENGVSWLHRFASLVAVLTFLLYMTGMLASNTGASLYMPHWAGLATSGQPSTGLPAKYAHIFAVLAATVSALTVIFVFLLRKSNPRGYLKKLGTITVGVLLAIAFLVLGASRGVDPVAVSVGYTCGMQVFFCLTVCLALFTRTDWRWDEPKTPDLASPSLRQILVFTTAAVFLQPLLGEGFRKKELGIAPHLVIGIAVTVCSLWVLEMALTQYSLLRTFKISAIFLAELVGLELFLGIITYSMNLDARSIPGSHPGLAVMNATHAAVGALLLAASLFVTFQSFKYFAPAESRTS
jgi:heme A synthase